MDLTPYLETLRGELMAAAAPGGPELGQAAELLSGPLEVSARLALLEVLSDATAEITAQLSAASVEVRLRGRDAELIVTEVAEPVAEPPAAEAEPVSLDGDLARLTLRMPEPLKERIEAIATNEGVSVNAWLVRAIAEVAGRKPAKPGKPGKPTSTSKRITGYAQA
jgi:predicted HicB family RNase H-like nuclease